MRTRNDHTGAWAGRASRPGVSGLTLALLLTTALAGLSAPTDLGDQIGERAGRSMRPIETAAMSALAHGLVVITSLAFIEAPATGAPTKPAPSNARRASLVVAPRSEDLRAGLVDLPPPALG